MRYLLTAIAVVAFCFNVHAQSDTVWYGHNWEVTGQAGAAYYRPQPTRTDSGYWVRDYYLSGRLQYEALSQNLKTEDWVGEAKWFLEDGTISSRRSFRKITKEGTLKTFFDNNKVQSEVSFKNWKRDGTEIHYYQNGKVASAVNWGNGLLNGESRSYFEDSQLSCRVFYKNGLSDSVYEVYTRSGNIWVKRFFSEGTCIGTYRTQRRSWDTLAFYTFKNNEAGGWFCEHEKRDTTLFYAVQNGLLEGHYFSKSYLAESDGYFSKGKMRSWKILNRQKGNMPMVEALPVNDSLVRWTYYGRHSGKLIADGFTKKEIPAGQWNFYTNEGEKLTGYNLLKPAGDPGKAYKYFDNRAARIFLPALFETDFSEGSLQDMAGADLAADYTAYDKAGKPVVKGRIIHAERSGIWSYSKAGKVLKIDYSKPVKKTEILSFINIEMQDENDVKNRSPFFIDPASVLIIKNNPDSYGGYSIEKGALIRDAFQKDNSIYDALKELVRKKAGSRFSGDMENALKSSFRNLGGVAVKEDRSFDSNATIFPVLLKSN